MNELYQTGDFRGILRLLPQWRSDSNSLENAVVLDGIEIVALLNTDAVDQALSDVDKLLGVKPYGDYLLLSLLEALKKVAFELNRVKGAREQDRTHIEESLQRVLDRYHGLVDSANTTD
jgi:hypothetical protein